MGDDFFDVLPVGARETTERDILVPNLDLTALSQETLDQVDLRALPQVIGSRFKAQAED